MRKSAELINRETGKNYNLPRCARDLQSRADYQHGDTGRDIVYFEFIVAMYP
jgi:hypothetical protein